MFFLRFKLCFSVFLWLSLLASPTVLLAQLRVGPKAGFQLGRTVYADEAYREQYTSGFRAGLQLGGVLNYRVNKLYSLHTELYYSQKGKSSRNRLDEMEPVKNRAIYDYIDLPVMLRLSSHKNYKKHKLEYFINFGPSINYWFGGRGTLESPELYEYNDTEKIRYKVRFKDDGEPYELVIENANRIQMSLDFGGGIIFDLGFGKAVMVELRNSIGIGKTYLGKTNSADYRLAHYTDNFESVNHVFGLSVAYLIDVDLMALLQKGRIRR